MWELLAGFFFFQMEPQQNNEVKILTRCSVFHDLGTVMPLIRKRMTRRWTAGLVAKSAFCSYRDPSSVPSTHTRWRTTTYNPLWPPQAPAHAWCMHTQRHKSVRIAKINLKEKRKLDQNSVPFIFLYHSTVSDQNLLVVCVYGLHGSVWDPGTVYRDFSTLGKLPQVSTTILLLFLEGSSLRASRHIFFYLRIYFAFKCVYV